MRILLLKVFLNVQKSWFSAILITLVSFRFKNKTRLQIVMPKVRYSIALAVSLLSLRILADRRVEWPKNLHTMDNVMESCFAEFEVALKITFDNCKYYLTLLSGWFLWVSALVLIMLVTCTINTLHYLTDFIYANFWYVLSTGQVASLNRYSTAFLKDFNVCQCRPLLNSRSEQLS